ncbi:unnamed protein product [Amoebophrya sp. A25]|nr:unnamed protein product [Amoebophrya sp. A25]|eukprot:GSA25T00000021001.1
MDGSALHAKASSASGPPPQAASESSVPPMASDAVPATTGAAVSSAANVEDGTKRVPPGGEALSSIPGEAGTMLSGENGTFGTATGSAGVAPSRDLPPPAASDIAPPIDPRIPLEPPPDLPNGGGLGGMDVEGSHVDSVFDALNAIGAPGDDAGQAGYAGMENHVQQDYARRSMHPMKVSFYELVIRQLMDDEFLDEALSLKNRSGMREAGHVEPNCLYKMYEENFGKLFSDQNKWTAMNIAPIPPIESNERHLDLDYSRFDLEGADKISYTDSYRHVMADDDPESLAKGEGKGGKDRDDKNKDGDAPAPKARPLHRKKANIFNKVHYNTSHKQMVRTVAFSPDGRFAASGSHDTTVKVLDVNKMYHYGTQHNDRREHQTEIRPVLRTLYDHTGPVNSLQFHPHLAYLFTASADKTVKVFDLTKPSTQLKALSSIPDSSVVQSMAVHPSGDFLFVGTQHPTIRLYDLTRLECFAGPDPKDYHTGSITDLSVTSDGKILASTSTDGEVRLWDVVSHKAVNTLTRPHQGNAVCSVKWSRNLRYFLTAGCDGKAKLWDVRKGGDEPVFNMNICSGRNLEYARAAFVGQERFIAVASGGNDLCILDAQTGDYLQGAVARGGGYHHGHHNQHSNPVFCIASHPMDTKFLTGSDDHKVRYCEIQNRPEDWVHYRDRQHKRDRGGHHVKHEQERDWWQSGDGYHADGQNYPPDTARNKDAGSNAAGKNDLQVQVDQPWWAQGGGAEPRSGSTSIQGSPATGPNVAGLGAPPPPLGVMPPGVDLDEDPEAAPLPGAEELDDGTGHDHDMMNMDDHGGDEHLQADGDLDMTGAGGMDPNYG